MKANVQNGEVTNTENNATQVADQVTQETQTVQEQPVTQAPVAQQTNAVMMEVSEKERKAIERSRKAKKVLIPVGIGLGAAVVGFITGRVTSQKEADSEQQMLYGTTAEPGTIEATVADTGVEYF